MHSMFAFPPFLVIIVEANDTSETTSSTDEEIVSDPLVSILNQCVPQNYETRTLTRSFVVVLLALIVAVLFHRLLPLLQGLH